MDSNRLNIEKNFNTVYQRLKYLLPLELTYIYETILKLIGIEHVSINFEACSKAIKS